MTETMARRPRATTTRHRAPLYAVALVALLAGLVPMVQVLGDFDRTALGVRNDTVWDLSLQVRVGDRVMPIASLPAEHGTTVREVLVPGDVWSFVWLFKGEEVATQRVDDDDVRRDDFVVEVPDDVTATLRERGAPPSP